LCSFLGAGGLFTSNSESPLDLRGFDDSNFLSLKKLSANSFSACVQNIEKFSGA